MCGRFQLLTAEQYEDLMELINEIDHHMKVKKGEIYPTNTVPIITQHSGHKKAVLAKWGFPNFKDKGSVINARAETIEEKPMFRKAFHMKRCLVPANGFFEWTQDPRSKAKYHIGLKDKPLFFMGGIYNTFVDKEGLPYTGFVIITTAANEIMSKIHHRMPLIIDKEYEQFWLASDEQDMETVRALLKPYDSKAMFTDPLDPVQLSLF